MNLLNHPDLIDRLAAAHALGTLRGGARRRFETLAREHPSVRAAALTWQGRLQGLTELQPAADPPPAVWSRIQNTLAVEREAGALQRQREAPPRTAPASGGGWAAAWWRGLGLAGTAAAVVAVIAIGVNRQERAELQAQVAALQTQLAATPRVEYVAVLVDEKAAASMLMTVDGQRGQLTLKRVGGYREADDRSLQLWALPPGGAPRSLGVLGRDAVLRLPADAQALREVPAVAISLEPLGGVPSERGPTGPVLFSGSVIGTPS